jgi:hypothetical protein
MPLALTKSVISTAAQLQAIPIKTLRENFVLAVRLSYSKMK